jgi:hypothetical protein
VNQFGCRYPSAWKHFTTIGAIVWLLYAIIVGAAWDDDLWWAYHLDATLVLCSLVFIFRDYASLARWPEAMLFLVSFLEFGRVISIVIGTSYDPLLPSRFDTLDFADDCTFRVAKGVFVITILLSLSLLGIGQLKLQFSLKWAIRCAFCLCLTIGILRLFRSSSWLFHNLSDFSWVSLLLIQLAATELARTSLMVSIAVLALASIEKKSFLRPIVLLMGGLFIVELSEWYIFDRFLAEEERFYATINGSEHANALTSNHTIHQLRSRIVEILVLFMYCTILVSTNKSPVQEYPVNNLDSED